MEIHETLDIYVKEDPNEYITSMEMQRNVQSLMKYEIKKKKKLISGSEVKVEKNKGWNKQKNQYFIPHSVVKIEKMTIQIFPFLRTDQLVCKSSNLNGIFVFNSFVRFLLIFIETTHLRSSFPGIEKLQDM